MCLSKHSQILLLIFRNILHFNWSMKIGNQLPFFIYWSTSKYLLLKTWKRCCNYVVKMTMSEGYCSFRVMGQVIKEPKTQSILSQPIKVQRASRDTSLLANTYHLSAGYYLVQNQIIASMQVDAYILSVLALWNYRGLMDDNCVLEFL